VLCEVHQLVAVDVAALYAPRLPLVIDKERAPAKFPAPRFPDAIHSAWDNAPIAVHGFPDAMAQRTTVRTTYDIERTLQPIYSGGSIALSEDGRILAACLGEDALITDVTNGKELGRIEGVRIQSSLFWSCG
jgi:hypothetical protein